MLEARGVMTNMYDSPGWDAHLLNGAMMDMLKKDCANTAELIETKPFYRWQEENKQSLSIVADSINDFTYALVIYNSMMLASQNKVCSRDSCLKKGANKIKNAAKKVFGGEAEVGVGGGTGTDDICDLYRKASNTGDFEDLDELMQLKNVKNVANDAGIGLDGIKIKIDRNPELLGKGVYGFTDGETITLYPDAFTDTETLVKTLGHERVHIYQVSVFGKATSTEILAEYEKAAYSSEKMWWDYYNFMNGGE